MTRRLRILFFGETWQGSSARSLCEALMRRSGVEVAQIGEDHFSPHYRRLELRIAQRLLAPLIHRDIHAALNAAFEQARPDALLVYKGYSLSAPLVRALKGWGIPCVLIYPDNSPHAFGGRHRRTVGEYDLVISAKPFHPALWVSLYGYRNRCVFVPHGYEPALHHVPGPASGDRYDVVLVANWRRQYEQLLQTFAQALGDVRLRVCIAGHGWATRNAGFPGDWEFPGAMRGGSYVELIRSAHICLAPVNTEVVIDGLRQPGDEDTTRTYELAAAGCFFIHRRTPFVQTLYDEATEVPMFDDGRELAAKVLHYLPLRELRMQMAAAAQHRAVPAYSIDARVEAIFAHVQAARFATDPAEIEAAGLTGSGIDRARSTQT